MNEKSRAILLSAVMVLSMVAAFGGLGTATATADPGPSGMVGVPSDQIGPADTAQSHAGPPDHALEEIPTHAAAWDVHTDRHASTLEVEIDVDDSGELLLRASDEVNHDGRTVAVDADTLEDAVGHKPQVAHGEHSSGEEWVERVEYEGGYANIDVERFSTNEISFDGTVSLSGDPADDGATYSYEMSDSDGVDDFEIELEGVENTNQRSLSDTFSDGDSTDITVEGSAESEVSVTLEGVDGPGDNVEFQIPTNGQVRYQPAVSDGVLYVGDDGGLFQAIDIESGEQIWEYEDGDAEFNQPAVEDGTVVVPETNTDYHLFGFDADTGNIEFTGPENVNPREILIDDGYIYLHESSVHKLDLDDGSEVWETDVEQSSVSGVTKEDGMLFVNSNHGNQIHKLDAGSGSIEWTHDTDYQFQITPVVSNGNVITGDNDGNIHAVDVDDGSKSWMNEIEGSTGLGSNPHIYEDMVVFFDDEGLYGFDLDTGSETLHMYETWMDDASDSRHYDMKDGVLYIGGSFDEHVYAVDLDSEETIWEVHLSDDRAGPTTVTDDAVYVGGADYIFELRAKATDPSLVIGSEEVSYDGDLDGEESITEDITLDPSEHSVDSSVDGSFNADIEWVEITESVDPLISINGNDIGYSGTLANGETTSLEADSSNLVEGTNTVDVTVSEGYSGPTGQVGLSYSHSAPEDQTVEYVGETWTERYNVSHSYVDDRDDATLEIPFSSDRVVDVRDVEKRVNGGSWQALESDDIEMDGTTLEAQFGDVSEGDEIDVRANGSKVDVDGGAIEVLEPTVEGDVLDTKFEIADYTDEFAIDVSGTQVGDWVHYFDEVSWQEADPYVEVTQDTQEIRAPGANTGATTRLKTTDLQVTPESGSVEVRIDDPDEPVFTFANATDRADVEWHDTRSGLRYVLYDELDNREVDAGYASSPVSFTAPGDGTYSIFQQDSSSTGDTGTGPTDPASSSFQWPMLFGSVSFSIAGLWYVSRRFGGRRGIRGNSLLLVGGTIVGTIAFELVTPTSLMDVFRDIATGPAGTIITGTAIVLSLWMIDMRTSRDVPLPIMVGTGVVVLLYVVETISPGTLSSGLEEVGPLLWISLIGGGLWFGRRYIQSRESPETEVTLELGDND